MRKIILVLCILLIIFVYPVSADLFAEMSEKVLVYNQNVDKVPGIIKSMFGNEEIHGIIILNDGSKLEVKAVTRDARVIQFGKVGTKIATNKGDCNEDGKLSAVDGLCALKMSIGKMQEKENLDVDENGNVTSLDARIILQGSVNLSSEVDPTLVVSTDEKTMNSIMNSEKPADTFFNALDTGILKIEAKSAVKGIILSLGNVVLKIARSVGVL
jgi:hypothetical protein